MEATESNLEIKLTQLRMNVEKTNSVIVSNNAEAIERHQQTLKTISANVNHMRLEAEAKKLEAKEEMTGIQTWNEDVDARLQEADIEIGKARKWMDERKREAEVIWSCTPSVMQAHRELVLPFTLWCGNKAELRNV